MLEAFDASGAKDLILLGDILYHGPRNDLPDEYAPKKVIGMLSDYKSKILAVRGNCEAEVDGMVLPFPVMADYAALLVNGCRIWLTHGHRFNRETPLNVREGDLLISGHTHVPLDVTENGVRFLNPGSVSIPKEGSRHSYMILDIEEDGTVTASLCGLE